MRYYGEIPDVPGLEDNAYELTEMFKDDLGEKWKFSLDEVAALSNFIGRKGTINYFKALKAGETYTPPGTNKTVDQYLKEYREARDNYSKGGKFKVKKRRNLKLLKNGGTPTATEEVKVDNVTPLLDMLAQGASSDDIASYAASVDPNFGQDAIDDARNYHLMRLNSPMYRQQLESAVIGDPYFANK